MPKNIQTTAHYMHYESTTALVSPASKVTLKIPQARLQQYVN